MTRLTWDCDRSGCRLAARFDPQLFDKLLPRGSSFIDVDGFTEISGHLLDWEHKIADASVEPDGQLRALKRKATVYQSQCTHCTVWLIRGGKPGTDWTTASYELRDLGLGTFDRDLTFHELLAKVAIWGHEADRNPLS